MNFDLYLLQKKSNKPAKKSSKVSALYLKALSRLATISKDLSITNSSNLTTDNLNSKLRLKTYVVCAKSTDTLSRKLFFKALRLVSLL